jgi:acetyl esterase
MNSRSLYKATFVSIVAGSALGATACDKTRTDDMARPTNPAVTPTAVTSSETHSAEMNKGGAAGTTTAANAEKAKDPMKAADADMKKVLEQLGALGGKPLSTLSAEEARKQPTPADAVKALLTKEGKSTAPLEMAKVENRKIPGAAGPIDARIYTPKTDDKKPLPVIVYFHGGGWVIADLDVYDSSPRALAKGADAIVVSADYRHAPENKFPAAHDDAFAAYEWVTKNAATFGGDPKRIAVAGESAGGNLAMNVAIMARDKGIMSPVHELLVYPVAQTSMDTPSYNEWALAKPLDKAGMQWFVEKTIRTPADKSDPRLDLVHANLAGLPKTTIVQAEIDPLKSDGDMLAKSLDAAGVPVDKKLYDGVTHEFFGMPGAAVGDAKDAQSYAAGRLKDAFKR